MRRVATLVAALLVAGLLSSCGLRVDTTASSELTVDADGVAAAPLFGTPTVTKNLTVSSTRPSISSSTSSPGANPTTESAPIASVTTPDPGQVTTPTTSLAPIVTAPVVTSATFSLVDFCAATKVFDITNFEAYGVFTPGGPDEVIAKFTRIQETAPPEIAQALADMRELVIQGENMIKSGEINSVAEFQAWMSNYDRPKLMKWGQANLDAGNYIAANCP